MQEHPFKTYLSGKRDLVIELQKNLSARPAIGPSNGGQGEKEKADWIQSWCAANGFPEPLVINAPDARVESGVRPSLAYVMPGADQERTLWLVAHMDIVPPGDLSLWESDPYAVRVEGDTLYGRGVEDNQQGLVSALLAFKAFLDLKRVPACNFGLLLVADEETSENMGVPYILERHAARLFGKNDAFLVPDGGSDSGKTACVAEKSLMWMKVSVIGKQCHASTPDEGVNSLIAASALVLKTRELQALFPKQDALYSPPYSTFEPTRKEENVPNVNTVPGLDVLYIDCRVLPEYNLDDVLAAMRALAAGVEKTYGARIEVEALRKDPAPRPTRTDSPVVNALRRAVNAVYGHDIVPVGAGGLTVSSQFRAAGFDAVVWSRMHHNPHVPNERSSIAWTLEGAEVMALMAETGLQTASC